MSQKSLIGMKTNKLRRNFLTSLNIAILLLVSGCGLKGDLYIPEKEAASTAPVAGANDDSETESEKKTD